VSHAAAPYAPLTCPEARRLRDTTLSLEWAAWEQGFPIVAGVDEAGRGPLAGPVVAAAVVLAAPLDGLDDSKKLTEGQREHLYEQLHAGDHAIGAAVVDATEIDRIGIQAANYRAMAEAVANLPVTPGYVLVDGYALPGLAQPCQKVIKGDSRSLSIAAASIVAKVTRDRMMAVYEAEYPGYGFGRHKGYGTAAHLAAIAALGPCPIHRTSFAPIARRPAPDDLFGPATASS